jgi:hypothetical protein
MKRLLRTLALTLAAACSQSAEPVTELVLVIDSDLGVPTDLDEISVRATGPDGAAQTAGARLGAGMTPLPRALVLSHESGPLGPLQVRVEGKRGGSSVVTRHAQASFVLGKSLVLPLHLVGACRARRCPDDQTCSELGCIDRSLDSDSLEEWSGDKPRLAPFDAGEEDGAAPEPMDASVADAGARDASSEAATPGADAAMCVPKAESCNGMDDDCDDRIDNGFNLATDVQNCGVCGMRCNTARREVCCAGSCSRSCM